MKPPVGSVPSIYETRLVYRNTKTNAVKDMSQDEFNNSRIWEDPAWKWDTTITKLVRKGTDIPAIQGFSLVGKERFDSIMGSSSKVDSTAIIMAMPKVIIGFGLDGAGTSWLKEFTALLATAEQQGIPVYFTSNNPGYFEKLFAAQHISIPVFSTDFTVIRTAARTNPAFYYLQSGTISGKYSYRQLDQLSTAIKSNTTP